MKKCLGLAMLIVGTIVGAGFASGREVVSFFGAYLSPWVAPICGLGFFVLCVMFLFIGSRVKKNSITEVNQLFFGKFRFVADFFLLLNSLVVLAGMLSAMDALFSMLYPLAPLYSILSGVLCAVLVSKGLRALLKCNSILVPIVIAILVVICSFNISDTLNLQPFSGYSLPAVVLYVSMNMMLACTFFVSLHDLNKKTIVLGSFLAALILTALMILIISAVQSGATEDHAMPILELAKRSSPVLFYVGIAVIAVSIFTTMLTATSTLDQWLKPFGGGEIFNVTIIVLAGLIVSNLGFENVVAYLYPIISIAGIIYMTITAIQTAKQIKPSSRRLDTCNFFVL